METKEEWRPVVRFEETHEVSSMGRVRHRKFDRLLSGRTFKDGKKYAVFSTKNRETVTPLEYVVTEAFLGERSENEAVIFLDDPRDYRLSNLTYADESAFYPCDCSRDYEEEWRPVVGWEERYEVSNHGRVRSLWRMFGGSKVFEKKLVTRTVHKDGYYRVSLKIGDNRKQFYVSELVLSAFVGLRPLGYRACHKDDVRLDDHLDILRWSTVQENIDEKTLRRRRDDCLPTECPYCGIVLVPRNCYPGLPRVQQIMCKSCHIKESASVKISSQW